jgi:hypothetical protein
MLLSSKLEIKITAYGIFHITFVACFWILRGKNGSSTKG